MKFDQVHDHLVKIYMGGLRHTTFLSGPPGVAKSACGRAAAQTCAEMLGMPFVDLGRADAGYRLPDDSFGFRAIPATVIDPLDTGGLPAVLDNNDGNGPYAARLQFVDLIPKRGKGMILVDDLPTAPPLTQASLFRTIWERDNIGEDWIIIATGNRAEDRAATHRMPTPIISKMGWIDFEPDLNGWIKHEASRDTNHLVRAFLLHQGGTLFVNFEPTHPGPFACPRTWSALSDLCKAYEPHLPPFDAITGWVGEGPAFEFQQFATVANELVQPDTILLMPDTADIPSSPGALYVVTTALAGRMTAANIDRILTYLSRPAMPNDYTIYCVRSALQTQAGRIKNLPESDKSKYRRIEATAAFQSFIADNQDFFV